MREIRSGMGKEYIDHGEQSIDATALGQTEKVFLTGILQGQTRKEIAEELRRSIASVDRYARTVFKVLDTTSTLHTGIKAIRSDFVDPESIFRNYDPNNLTMLAQDDLALLDLLTTNEGEGSTNARIAAQLGDPVSEKAVQLRFVKIGAKLGTHSKEHTAFVYEAAKKLDLEELPQRDAATEQKSKPLTDSEIAVLRLRAQGHTNKEVGRILELAEVTVEKSLERVGEKQGTRNATQRILVALNEGEIMPEEVLERRDPGILRRLLEDEEVLLNHMVQNNGENATNKGLAEITHWNYETIKDMLSAIGTKLETRNRFHTAAVYNAATMIPDLAGLTDRGVEIVSRLAQGQSSKQMADEMQLGTDTIDDHRRRIFKNLRVHSSTQAVVKAVRYGVVDPELVVANRNLGMLDELTDEETTLMEAIKNPQVKRGTNVEISDITGIEDRRIDTLLASVKAKLQTTGRFHSAAVYAAATKLRSRQN